MPSEPKDATILIAAMASGDQVAGKKLFRLLYDEIHRIAHNAMQKESPGHILQTTALVHETYLKMIPDQNLQIQDRIHFFRLAGRAMRQILVSEYRERMAAKRGSGKIPVSLDTNLQVEAKDSSSQFSLEDIDTLNTSLKKLENNENHQWMVTLVDLHFFAGFSFNQVAEMMGISKGKVMNDWAFIKAWLQEEMER